MGDGEANLREALRRLMERVAIDSVSALYETPPMGSSVMLGRPTTQIDLVPCCLKVKCLPKVAVVCYPLVDDGPCSISCLEEVYGNPFV